MGKAPHWGARREVLSAEKCEGGRKSRAEKKHTGVLSIHRSLTFFLCAFGHLLSTSLLHSQRHCFTFFFFWSRRMASRILVPQPGLEPTAPAVEAWSPNHWAAWTAREFPFHFFLKN